MWENRLQTLASFIMTFFLTVIQIGKYFLQKALVCFYVDQFPTDPGNGV
jgi:hypothetical protein